MDIKRAYRFRFYPTLEQEVILAQTFGCVRVVYNQMLEAVVDDDTERPALAAAKQDDGGLHLDTLRLEDAKRLAKENPVAVANIIKGWVNGDSPAMGGGGLKGPGA